MRAPETFIGSDANFIENSFFIPLLSFIHLYPPLLGFIWRNCNVAGGGPISLRFRLRRVSTRQIVDYLIGRIGRIVLITAVGSCEISRFWVNSHVEECENSLIRLD
jgi:hypothetical protein